MIALLAMAGVLTFLSGCTQVNQEINSDSTGFWNEYIVWPLSQTLLFFADLFSGSYGLSIIVVTIIIRLILLPLNIKQLKSSKAMQDIQPELQSLREQYSSKDAQTQQKLQQETMQLFQKHGVNPLAGCLPIIVQMPILIGFYHAIMRTSEIQTHNFLWLELGSSDPIPGHFDSRNDLPAAEINDGGRRSSAEPADADDAVRHAADDRYVRILLPICPCPVLDRR